jgi:hypothetical protein
MAQIMEPWRRTPRREVERQPRHNVMKCLAYGTWVDLSTAPEGEKWGISQEAATVFSLEQVILEHHLHPWTKRHEAALIKLGLSDNQQSTIEIYVLDAKPADLAYPEPQTIEDGKHCVVTPATVQGPSLVRKGSGHIEQTTCVGRIENIRFELISCPPRA